MMTQNISEEKRKKLLAPLNGKKVRMVLDTDTYNEIDDQFAVVYSLLSPEQMEVEAIYAAPFHNERSSGPEDGMEKSYEEILRLLNLLNIEPENFAFRGSTQYLPTADQAVESEACQDLIEKAMKSEEPLYVATIGAPTNVASAILLKPEIKERIVVVWLGGRALYCPTAEEFNLRQDPHASRVLFDSGVALVHIPCFPVTSHLTTTVPELERYLEGKGKIADYLVKIFKEYHHDHFAWGKVIWDIATIAWIVNQDLTPSELVSSPILTEDLKWDADKSRHLIRCVTEVKRNEIFRDLFVKIENHEKNTV